MYKGYQAKVKIFVDTVEIGKATMTLSHVSVKVENDLDPYYEIENPVVYKTIVGKKKISGTLKGTWINVSKLTLLGILTAPFSWSNNIPFTLKIMSSEELGSPILTIENCRFTKATISVPQDGFLEEDYDFISETGTAITSEVE